MTIKKKLSFCDKWCKIRSEKQNKQAKKEGRRKMKRPYSAILIARYIISREAECNRSVSNLRLQKLLYFVQAYFFLSLDEPCFDNRIEAWDFGPVVPAVYHKYKRFGSMIIQENEEYPVGNIDEEDCQRIDEMLDACADKTTRELVNITHHQTPWKRAYKNLFSNEITQESIRNMFAEMRQQA